MVQARAASIAVATIRGVPTGVELVRFVLFDRAGYDSFKRYIRP